MKKTLAILLVCIMALGLTACSFKSGWTEEDFTFVSSEENFELEEGYELIVYEDASYVSPYDGDSYDEYDVEFATNRGLELGMKLDDFKKLYSVVKGFAVWELYSGENGMYTSFDQYNNQEPSEMYGDDITNAWLDIGFYKEDGKWKMMQDIELSDIWFCDADFDDYEECVILSVNVDSLGKIIGIGCNHFSYDEAWAEWQNWAE